jgi:cupin fold WbuC family metalloprotein
MIINEALLNEVTDRAKASPRLRMNYNLHDSPEAKAQRLLNALEPGTELPIHRHQHTAVRRERLNIR